MPIPEDGIPESRRLSVCDPLLQMGFTRSANNLWHHIAVDICQSVAAPGVVKGQPLVVQPQQMQNCRMPVVDRYGSIYRLLTDFVR